MSKKKNKVKTGIIIHSAKVPLRIVAEKGTPLRLLRLFLDDVMEECRALSNRALLEGICFDVRGIDLLNPKGQRMSLSGAIYNILTACRKLIPSSIFATLVQSYVLPALKKFNADRGKSNLAMFRNKFLLLHASSASLTRNGDQFVLRSSELRLKRFYIDDTYIKNYVGNIIKGYQTGIEDARKKDGDEKRIQVLQGKMEDWQNIEKEILSKPSIVGWLVDSITLESMLSWKDEGTKAILNGIVDSLAGLPSDMSLCDSRLIIEDGKMFAIIVHRVAAKAKALDPNVVVGVDMGVNCPVVCALNNSKERAYFGDRDEILARKNGFQALRRRKQRALGLGSKTVKWEKSKKEKNWVNRYYHTLAARIIQFAIRCGAGTIHLENLTGLRDEMSEFNRLIMIPSKLTFFIQNAAIAEGIRVIIGNPKNSSIRCSKCGYTSKENRNTEHSKDFCCVKCGYSCHADYNAAVNIANWTQESIEDGYESDDSKSISGSVGVVAGQQICKIAV